MEAHAIAANSTATAAGDLVSRARSGDVAAFESLYRQTSSRVFALCLRMTGNRALAEDVTQDAFTSAWRKLSSYRGPDEGFGAWIRRVAINAVLTERRARARREARERTAGEPTVLEHAAAARGIGHALDLETAIARLPRRAREVFVLHDLEGYRHAEVARLLDVAPGTSKAQLHRARRMLREALQS